jgi:DNA-binding HxlR family transcriptional regulator
VEYRLTARGRALAPLMEALRRYAAASSRKEAA